MKLLDDFCRSLAYRIHPETGEYAERYHDLVNDLTDMSQTVGRGIPEVKAAIAWILDKDSTEAKPDSTYMRYRSLVHFKDVLFNDYQRKIKNTK